MVKAGAMALKAVVPGVPKNVRDRELLKEDLRQIGCHGFTGKPWGLRMEDLSGGTPRRQGQPVGRNRASSPGEVDSKRVEEGLQLRKRRRRYGFSDRPVYRRDVFR